MSPPPVDKHWVKKGLRAYSTDDIIKTLGLFGVKTDEAACRQSFETDDPEQVAERWEAVWRGEGKYAFFPQEAASELFRRLSTRVDPGEVAELIDELVLTLEEEDGPPDEALLEDLEATLGRCDDAAVKRAVSLTEVSSSPLTLQQCLERALGRSMRAAHLLEKLVARAFPDQEVLAQALLTSASNPERGKVELSRLARDSARGLAGRADVCRLLVDRRVLEPDVFLALLTEAITAVDWHTAERTAELLAELSRALQGVKQCGSCHGFHQAHERHETDEDLDEIPY